SFRLIGLCDQLTAVKDEESTLQGNTLTLSYTLSRDIRIDDNFFWYRQYPGKPPEFLIYISGTNNSRPSEFLKSAARFSTKLSGKNHLDLQISSAAVTDSAVYYCALQPTVTGNTKTLYKNLWTSLAAACSCQLFVFSTTYFVELSCWDVVFPSNSQ
uniref:Immunoglobulin V-set domain-containing protein n=1 Tax=Oreochromis aureus TaxID=47969 RepID=A0AAZ1WV41_OREAU